MRYRSEWIWLALGTALVLAAILAMAWTRASGVPKNAYASGKDVRSAYAPGLPVETPAFQQRWAPVSPSLPGRPITPDLPTRAHEAPEPAAQVQRVRALQKRNYRKNRGVCAAHGMRKVYSANKRSWRCKR